MKSKGRQEILETVYSGNNREVSMKAQFHLSADLEVIVEAEHPCRTVKLTLLRGVCYEHPHSASVQPAGTIPIGPCKAITADAISLTRSNARALASAIMGCAAEL